MPTDTREAVKIHYIALTKPELVRATIRKQKDMTRRVIVHQNSTIGEGGDWKKLDFYGTFRYQDTLDYSVKAFRDEGFPDPETGKKNYGYLHVPYDFEENETIYRVYPRWEPGTLLGIKESWAVSSFSQQSPGKLQICYRAGGAERPTPPHPDDEGDCDRLWWEVDMDTWQKYAFKNQWRGPRFMPGWAVRLIAKVKSVRPERVQEITEGDAQREGVQRLELTSGILPDVPPPFNRVHPMTSEYREAFAKLWDVINAERGFSWEMNPWVWRLEWELITSTGLQVEK